MFEIHHFISFAALTVCVHHLHSVRPGGINGFLGASKVLTESSELENSPSIQVNNPDEKPF